MVSTVEPLALGEEAREDVRTVREPRGIREDGDMAMESPSKRIRLSSAEEEGGPCDSQDGAVLWRSMGRRGLREWWRGPQCLVSSQRLRAWT